MWSWLGLVFRAAKWAVGQKHRDGFWLAATGFDLLCFEHQPIGRAVVKHERLREARVPRGQLLVDHFDAVAGHFVLAERMMVIAASVLPETA